VAQIDQGSLQWLLENEKPGVRLRTLRHLCGFPSDDPELQATRQSVTKTFTTAHDLSWITLKGQILVYNLTGLAEMGLTRQDIPIEPVVDRLLNQPFDANCADLMTLRALVMLGYSTDDRLLERLEQMEAARLPDGGWLCLHRVTKMNRVPKSCIKVAMHGLLLAAELHRHGVELPGNQRLIDYFRKRRLFYRMDKPDELVINQPGRRMTEIFFPQEYFHVGLPVLLEALAVLGAGAVAEFDEAWRILESKKDAQGRIPLEGTLPGNKAYLPKERIGRPSKWGTFYAYRAWGCREGK
jgi:hypothetical protein